MKVSESEVYLCVGYMAPSSSAVHAGTAGQLPSCPYDTVEDDITDAQNAGGRIIVCGDMNGSTAEQDDYSRPADVQGFFVSQRREHAWVLTFPKDAN